MLSSRHITVHLVNYHLTGDPQEPPQGPLGVSDHKVHQSELLIDDFSNRVPSVLPAELQAHLCWGARGLD